MRANDDGRTVAAMDVLVPKVGELIGGSQREERLEVRFTSFKARWRYLIRGQTCIVEGQKCIHDNANVIGNGAQERPGLLFTNLGKAWCLQLCLRTSASSHKICGLGRQADGWTSGILSRPSRDDSFFGGVFEFVMAWKSMYSSQ